MVEMSYPYVIMFKCLVVLYSDSFRQQQQTVLSLISDYFSFLPPEKRDIVVADFMDQSDTILACKYMSIHYMDTYSPCLLLLQRAIRRQDAFIHFSWMDNEIIEAPPLLPKANASNDNSKVLTKLIGAYGNHPLMTVLSIEPLIYPEPVYQAALQLSPEECVVDFFMRWAIDIERQQQFVVYQYDSTDPDQFELFFVSVSLAAALDKILEKLPNGHLMGRFLRRPPREDSTLHGKVKSH